MNIVGLQEVLLPGIRATLTQEARGMNIEIHRNMDDIRLVFGKHSVPLEIKYTRGMMEEQGYEYISNQVRAGVKYLRAKLSNNTAKYRAFRTKLRSIRARSRQWP